MDDKRATALPDFATLLKLWDAFGLKLIEATERLPSKQRVGGSNPSRDALRFDFSPVTQKIMEGGS